MSIIFGIDPGTTTVGFCLMERQGSQITLLEYGVIETPSKLRLELKLSEIADDLEDLIDRFKPDLIGIEKLFFSTNRKTAIDVAHSRGMILYLCEKRGIPIVEFTPLQVKKGICGNGSASKGQIQNAVKRVFKLEDIPKPDDAADAMAIAYLASLSKRDLI